MLFCLTGCFKANSMDEIKIATSVYPIEFVVKTLYGNHSTVISIYPHDASVITDDGPVSRRYRLIVILPYRYQVCRPETYRYR